MSQIATFRCLQQNDRKGNKMNDLNKEDEVFEYENKDEIEAINAVRRINEEIHEQTEEKNGFCPLEGLEFNSNGFAFCVKFLGERIFCSEDDERICDEKTDEYEPIENFLRRKVIETVEIVGKINVELF